MLDTRFYFSSLFLFLSTERRSDAGIISLATIKSVPLMPSKRRARNERREKRSIELNSWRGRGKKERREYFK